MLMALIISSFRWTRDLILRPARQPIEYRQQTSPDNQLAEPPSDMVHKRPNEHTSVREDNSKRIRGPENERQGGHLATRIKDLENVRDKLVDDHQGVVNKLHESQTLCGRQQQEINSLKEKLRGTSELLGVRNRELKVAKTFLSKEDPFSTADAVQAVCDLNSEIMQTATYLADHLGLKRVHCPVGNIPDGPCKPIFTALVSPRNHWDQVDVGSLELALQGFLVVWVYLIISAWGFGEASGLCDNLYSKLRETEDPAVASNWRALTRRTLFNIDTSREDLPRHIVSDAIQQVAFLLSSCGAGEFSENNRNIHRHASEKLGSLFHAARKLNKMIGENIVSRDLVVTIVGGGYPFNAEYMEEVYPGTGANSGQRAVICTTNLGLCERSGIKEEKMFLKPKVFLRDV